MCIIVDFSIKHCTLDMISDDPQTFELTYRLARNVPVDLYYLMDLSYTMADDKETLASLGVRIGLFLFFCADEGRCKSTVKFFTLFGDLSDRLHQQSHVTAQKCQ